MTKAENLADPNSCWNKARDDEHVFVLLERDAATPGTIRDWVRRRWDLRKNEPGDRQTTTALYEADEIEAKQHGG